MGRGKQDSTSSREDDKVVFIMATSEMQERVERMHDFYDQHGKKASVCPDVLQDPWAQITHSDMMHHIMSLEMQLETSLQQQVVAMQDKAPRATLQRCLAMFQASYRLSHLLSSFSA